RPLLRHLDHDRLRATMREILTHGRRPAGLPRKGQRLRGRRHSNGLIARLIGIRHSLSVPAEGLSCLSGPPIVDETARPPERYRRSIRIRFRQALAAGPRSSAACTTFERPKAKSISSPVKTRRTTVWSPARARYFRSSFSTPSALASRAWIRARGLAASAAST